MQAFKGFKDQGQGQGLGFWPQGPRPMPRTNITGYNTWVWLTDGRTDTRLQQEPRIGIASRGKKLYGVAALPGKTVQQISIFIVHFLQLWYRVFEYTRTQSSHVCEMRPANARTHSRRHDLGNQSFSQSVRLFRNKSINRRRQRNGKDRDFLKAVHSLYVLQ